ncbi:MAG: hypothetical protein QOG40_2430, partial [Solirubrobacteraceae bacterium]|nr:hypothetical protein [Solirubrobacteraceae bacterium]
MGDADEHNSDKRSSSVAGTEVDLHDPSLYL